MSLFRLFSRSFFVLVTLLGFVWASPAKVPWAEGEQLSYSISWGIISAGSAIMNARPVPGDKMEFLSVARNNGAFRTIYPVADTIYTLVQNQGLLPEIFNKSLREGSFFSRSIIRFDRIGKKAWLADTVFKDVEHKKIKSHTDTSIMIKGWEHCIVSAFYLVRGMDLKTGKDTYFAAVSGKKRYSLRVIIHDKEIIKTDLGTFRCVKVEPVLQGDGIFKTSGRLFIWISDDERRLPVLMKTEITIGSVKAELIDFHQGPKK